MIKPLANGKSLNPIDFVYTTRLVGKSDVSIPISSRKKEWTRVSGYVEIRAAVFCFLFCLFVCLFVCFFGSTRIEQNHLIFKDHLFSLYSVFNDENILSKFGSLVHEYAYGLAEQPSPMVILSVCFGRECIMLNFQEK